MEPELPLGPEAPAQPGWSARLRGLALDVTPLRQHRDFRLLWTARSVSFFGSEISYVALQFQVYALTKSALAVGLLGLCELVPLLGTALLGGALADARDRRRMVQLVEAGSLVVSVLLLVNALLPTPRLWALYVLAAASAGLVGLGRPSIDAMLPRLVPKEQLPAAAALSTIVGSAGAISGPALAGVLIAYLGMPVAYGIDVLTFVVALATLSKMREMPPVEAGATVSLRSIAEGFRYAIRQPVLMGTYIVDFNAMLFGFPRALFPALAVRFGGPQVLGLLNAAPYVGSLLASATSGWTGSVRRHGRAIMVAIMVWGAAIVLFGLTGSLWVALLMLAVAGAADQVSGIFRMTIWNQTIPDAIRGRLAGIEFANVASGPLLGDVEAGLVASLTSVRFSIVSGGLMCLVGTALLVVALPAFWRYDAGASTTDLDGGSAETTESDRASPSS